MLLGAALVLGFMRKTAYVGGLVLSLMIWSIDEGFGGPYGPGATDIGAAVMYAFLFIGFLIMEKASNYGRYSLDAAIERRWKGWRILSEVMRQE